MSTETGTQHRTIRRHTKSHLGSGPKGNIARANPARDYGRFCLCGCGQTVAPTARYVKGHFRNAPSEERSCVVCGRSFKVPNTAERRVCTGRDCDSPSNLKERQRVVALSQQQTLATVRDLRAHWTKEERRIFAARKAAYARRYYDRDEPLRRAERDALLRQFDATLKRNAVEREQQTDRWLRSLSSDDRAMALEVLKDQERDERRQQIQYEASLDETYEDGNPKAERSGGVHFDREEDMWPYIAERSKRPNIRKTIRKRFNGGDEKVLAIAKDAAAGRGGERWSV